jgi:alpha-2-macroglobulin
MSRSEFGQRGTRGKSFSAAFSGLGKTFAGLVLAVALVSCGNGGKAKGVIGEDGVLVERDASEDAASKKREARRLEAAKAAEQEFTYFRYRLDTTGDQPVACLVFSAPLDTKRDYSPFVEFRPSFNAALSVEGRELCIGGLSFGSERSATLLAGFPSLDGRTLKREETFPIDFADRPTFVGFKGGGIILPRSDADGLPIETVNVDKVQIKVSRVNDRALVFKRLGAGETVRQGAYAYTWGEGSPQDVEEEIFSGTMMIKNVQNASVVTVFPMNDVVGTLKPGAYFISVTDAAKLTDSEGPAASANRWIMLTDLAITAYEGEHGLDVTLRSLKDGRPAGEAVVQLIASNNAVLAEARPDGQGRVKFDKPITSGQGNMAARMILARTASGETAMLDLQRAPVDLSEHAVGGRLTPGTVDAFVYTERGIYRPGENVELSALLRDRAGRQVTGRKGNLIVYRPNGLVASKVRFEDPKSGAVLNTFALPKGASRGEWRAAIEIDGVTGEAGEARFSVEDFVPQRIAVDLKVDEKAPMAANTVRQVGIGSRFLYGAPGAGLTVKGEARLEVQLNPFPAFEGFNFGRHDAVFEEQLLEFEDMTTDGAGRTSLRLAPGDAGKGSGRPLRLNTVISVLEPGGRAVSESARVPYRPDPLYIGLKPRFEYSVDEGGEAAFDVAAINGAGTGVAQKLKWQMLAIDEHYDWYNEGGEWRWRTSRTVTKVNEGVITTNAKGIAEIKATTADWGLHELIVQSDSAGVASSQSFYVGWGGEVSEDGVEAPDRVRVVGPAKPPTPGKSFEITIDAPYSGQAQVVVATDRVLSVQNVAVKEGGSRLRLTAGENWGEGAYVLVSVYTARNPDLQAKPRRAVGVLHVPLDMAARTFKVAIDAPELVRPDAEQSVNVTFTNGPKEPVFMTLAAVDEGILQLTKFKSPNPVEYYYGRKALGVQLYDDYGRLLDPNLGLPAEVRSGGDQLGGEGLSVVPVKSIALYSGLVDVGRDGKATVKFKMPEFNGELRLMAVAWSKSGVGSAEDKMTVRQQAPSDLILPRFLAPGDEAFLTASIDNVELGTGAFASTVSGKGPVAIGTASFSRNLKKGERADAPVRVQSTAEGIASVSLAVKGPENFASNRTYQIQSRSPYLPEARAQTALMQPGQTYALGADLLQGFVPGSADVTVGFSRLPVNPATLYASLDRYPYGCTEQTTSRAMPLLYAEQLVAMGARGARDSAKPKVQEAINTLLNRQSADGAFGLWREGDGYATPWLGAYTTDFMYRAKQAGYNVPDEAMTRAYTALRTVATGDSWRVYGYDVSVHEYAGSNETDQQMMYRSGAYALYVLAKAGEAKIARLRYLHDREMNNIESPLARAHIAAGLALLGDRSRAKSAFAKAQEAAGYQNSSDYYQTPLRDTAAILALAAEVDMTDSVTVLAGRIARETPEPNMLTTQEKAFLLLAVNGLTKGDPNVSLGVTGLGTGKDNQRQYLVTEAQLKTGVNFKLGGKAPIFRTVLVTGSPVGAPPVAASNLRADKRLYTLSGGTVDLANVRQGDRIVIGLTVTPEEQRENPLIIADLLPAGFEIETVLRPADGAGESGSSGAFDFLGQIAYPQTQQAQDDRFVAAVNTYGTAVRLGYIVRAVTPGNFAMPGVVVEDMYRPEVFARSAAGRVRVTSAAAAPGGQ